MKPLYLLALLLIVSSCQKTEVKSELPPITESYALSSQTNLSYVGRWIDRKCSWAGGYIKTKFTGDITIDFSDISANTYFIKVDSGDWIKHSIIGGSSYTIKSTGGIHMLTIAQGIDYHYTFNPLTVTGSISTITLHSKLIEWIGDSITVSYLTPHPVVGDYAWICSEALGAEHTQIAYPGICLVNGMDNQYFKSTCTGNIAWQFTYTPDIICINLGTNDANHKVSDSAFKTTYITFIKQLRSKYGNIPIFLLRPFNGAKWGVIQQVYQSRLNASDRDVILVNTTGWIDKSDTVDGLHPNDTGQAKIAVKLETILKPYVN